MPLHAIIITKILKLIMQKNQLCFMLLAGFIISNSLLSCKKDAAPSKPDCKIVGVVSGSDVTTFTYNTDGKLSSQINANETKKFSYVGNTIIITSTTDSKINSVITVSLNANGLASNAFVTDSNGTFQSNIAYEYNGIELSRSIQTTASGGNPDTVTYTWSGGNLVSIDFGSGILTSNYSTDQPSQTGDVEDLGNLLQGFVTNRSKNLVTSNNFNGEIAIFNYTFDEQGKITAVNTVGRFPATFNYQYDCN